MLCNFKLKSLSSPRIDTFQISIARQTLQEITALNLQKSAFGSSSAVFTSQKEELIRSLKLRSKSQGFEDIAGNGRERLLLGIYLEYASDTNATWLPKFDTKIAHFLLGSDVEEWHAARRRDIALLFFTHFDRLPAIDVVCKMLSEAYAVASENSSRQSQIWHHYKDVIFALDGPERVARAAQKGEKITALIERFAIPSDGRLAELLRKVFLMNALKYCPLGQEVPALAQIEELKTERASVSQLMGASALQIMVQRVAREGGRKWSGEWSNWITRLGCDPRHGRATAEGARWWGWATDDELRLAQQGVTGLTLRFFIEFLGKSLQGTEKEPQFALRARFLLGLFDSGKIQSARLALNWSAYQRLDSKYRDVWTVSHLSATTDETSMISLKCSDDIFVIEGTHSFGLRMFHKNFPIPSFWERPKQTYQDRDLRVSPGACPVFLPHDPRGKWVNEFFRHLRNQFHVEWNDVRL